MWRVLVLFCAGYPVRPLFYWRSLSAVMTRIPPSWCVIVISIIDRFFNQSIIGFMREDVSHGYPNTFNVGSELWVKWSNTGNQKTFHIVTPGPSRRFVGIRISIVYLRNLFRAWLTLQSIMVIIHSGAKRTLFCSNKCNIFKFSI